MNRLFQKLVAYLVLISLLIVTPNFNLNLNSLGSNNFQENEPIEIDSPFSAHNYTAKNQYNLNELKNGIKSNLTIYNSANFKLHGEYLFYIQDGIYLSVINVSNPENPLVVGDYPSAFTILDYQPDGTKIYFATNNRFNILNIQNPGDMKVTSFFNYLDSITTFLVEGDTLYLVIYDGANSYLRIYLDGLWDESYEVCSENLGPYLFRQIIKRRNTLILGSDSGVMRSYLVLDPTGPIHFNDRNVDTPIINMKLFNNQLFAVVPSTVFVLKPDNFQTMTQYNLIDVSGFCLHENLGYFSSLDGNIYIMDIINQNDIFTIATLNVSTPVRSIAIFGSYMIFSTLTQLYIVQVARDLSSPITLFQSEPITVNNVRIFGFYAYIATSTDLKIVDLRTNSIAGIYNYLNTPVRDVYVNEDILYALFEDDYIRMVNVQNPADPQSLGTPYYLGLDFGISLYGDNNLLIVSHLQNGIQILNITNSTNIQFLSSISVEDGIYSYQTTVMNDYLYVANYNRISVYEISNILYPSSITNFSRTYVFSLDVSYPYLSVGTTAGYDIFNISISTMEVIFQATSGGTNTRSIKKCGNILYLGRTTGGVQFMNVSKIDQIQEIYSLWSSSVYSLDVLNSKMVVANSSQGFEILKIRETPIDFINGLPFLDVFG